LITEILTLDEKKCNFDNFYFDFPNALAFLSIRELKKIDSYTKKRLENIEYYNNIIDKKYNCLINNFTSLKNNYN
jgi:hypothetical protein